MLLPQKLTLLVLRVSSLLGPPSWASPPPPFPIHCGRRLLTLHPALKDCPWPIGVPLLHYLDMAHSQCLADVATEGGE